MQVDAISATRPPPGGAPETQDARGGDTRSSRQTNPNYVRIVNAVENGSPVIKRKVAEHYVLIGRAEWVGADQLRLNSHPANKRAAAQAATDYGLAEMPAHRGDNPNLVQMRRDDRKRYTDYWQTRRGKDGRTDKGKGAVGYTGPERTVHFGARQ
jgi:hypothetical protein